jgi:hypothetical protein
MTSPDRTVADRLVHPPAWAERTLRLLLARDTAETVAGDLLEEYRLSVYPSRSRWQAEVWYVGQVLGFIGWIPIVCGLALAVLLGTRAVLDTFDPPADWGPRSALSTWSAVTVYLVASAGYSWHRGRIAGAALIALATHVLAWTLAFGFDLILFAAAIQHDPARRAIFDQTGGWGEEWGVPLLLLPIVAMLGVFGGLGRRAPRQLHAIDVGHRFTSFVKSIPDVDLSISPLSLTRAVKSQVPH